MRTLKKEKVLDEDGEWSEVESRRNKKVRFRDEKICKVQKDDKGDEYVIVDAIIDSGAADTIIPSNLVEKGKVRENALSKKRQDTFLPMGDTYRTWENAKLKGLAKMAQR